ncbi:DUF6442 family protein [Eggerthella sinensis]|jgi:hypothetical protein|uniref:DUF6442 family protein n=1 Tax=Eggerthella sinensis TaxID=242230 RepID=UPI00266CBFFC|nr:DUF6442 family protein [Eggerthella sinensis]
MEKSEILEKSRRDNDGIDERFRLIEQRAGYVMMSVMMLVLALVFVWDFAHGRETNGMAAVFLSGCSAMCFYRFYQLRLKSFLFFGAFATLGAVSFAINHVLATM